MIFGHDNHSVLSGDQIIRKVIENEDKKNLAEKLSKHERKPRIKELLSLKVTFKNREKVYNLYTIQKWKDNLTQSYEYETKDPQFFKRKLESLTFDIIYDIWIFNKKVNSMEELLEEFENEKSISRATNGEEK